MLSRLLLFCVAYAFQLLTVVSLSLSRMGASLVEVQCIQMLFISVVMTDLSCEAHLRYNVRQMEHGAKQQAFVKVTNQQFFLFFYYLRHHSEMIVEQDKVAFSYCII